VHVQAQVANIDEKQRRVAKISTWYKKSMSMNQFAVTDLRPEVELMHLLRMRRYYRHKSRQKRYCTREMITCLWDEMNSNMT